jgi:hypothetical protein
MAIDDRPTVAWNESDLQQLCDEHRREQPRLEFKSELKLDRDAEKRDVEQDVEGLANAGGGHIIYGISETQTADGSKVAAALTPLSDGGLYERLNNHLGVFNQIVQQQTDFLATHIAEIVDATLGADNARREALANAAYSISFMLHANGIGDAKWYADLKQALARNEQVLLQRRPTRRDTLRAASHVRRLLRLPE